MADSPAPHARLLPLIMLSLRGGPQPYCLAEPRCEQPRAGDCGSAIEPRSTFCTESGRLPGGLGLRLPPSRPRVGFFGGARFLLPCPCAPPRNFLLPALPVPFLEVRCSFGDEGHAGVRCCFGDEGHAGSLSLLRPSQLSPRLSLRLLSRLINPAFARVREPEPPPPPAECFRWKDLFRMASCDAFLRSRGSSLCPPSARPRSLPSASTRSP